MGRIDAKLEKAVGKLIVNFFSEQPALPDSVLVGSILDKCKSRAINASASGQYSGLPARCVPSVIHVSHGMEFCSMRFRNFCDLYGIIIQYKETFKSISILSK